MTEKNQSESANVAGRTAKLLLEGSTLDHFCAYSLVVNISFLRLPIVEGLPSEVWLSANGRAEFLTTEAARNSESGANGNIELVAGREDLLPRLYRLVGKEVLAVKISSNGALDIRFDNGSLFFFSDDLDFEEIWAITSETPEPYGSQAWAVFLTGQRELVARRP